MSPKRIKQTSAINTPNPHDRIILDLKLKGLSLKEIRDHLIHCLNTTLSIRKIREILENYGKKAEKLNEYYDKKVFAKIQVAEADEIYQGMNSMYIGIAEKYSGYIIRLQHVDNKNAECFVDFFQEFGRILPNISLWITDGLPTYNPVMDSIFSNIPHLLCHVHTYRDLMKEQDVYNRKARRALTKLRQSAERIKFIQNHMYQNEKQVEINQKLFNQARKERDEFYCNHNIQKYSKTPIFKKQRKRFVDQLGFFRTMIKSYEKQVKHWKNKLIKQEKEEVTAKQHYQETKTIALQSGRLLSYFKQLMDCHWLDFERLMANYCQILTNSKYPIAVRILKILKNKPKIFNDKTEKIQALVPPNRANTNTIESIFGRYRLFFRKYRTMKNTKYARAIFDILRFYHNFTPPYNGFNNDISPIKRLGVKTNFKTALDCLCPLLF